MYVGLPGGSDGKESACSARDLVLNPRLGRSPGEGSNNLLQYSCLENPMDKGAWWATVHGVVRVGQDSCFEMSRPMAFPFLSYTKRRKGI